MKVIFYFVRHGQTRFNLAHRMQGFCDSPLTEQGIEDGRKAGEALRDVPFTRAYSSSAERARDTIDLILAYHPNVPYRDLKDLREFDYGDYDGMLIAHIAQEIQKRGQLDSFKDVGGDDTASLWLRTKRAFDTILSECKDGDRILIVSHGSFGRHLLMPMFGIDPDPNKTYRYGSGIWLPNGGIMKFMYEDGRWSLLQLPCAPELFEDQI